jgi:hypothetical protein
MAFLTREDLLKLAKEYKENQTKKITIEGLGDIEIKMMTEQDRQEATAVAVDEKGVFDTQKFENYILYKCIVKPKLDIKDLSELSNLPSGIVSKILTEIYKFSKIL